MEHLYRQGSTFYYRRRIPKDLKGHYAGEGKYRSGFVQRSLSTGDLKKAETVWAQVHAELESEWARVRSHVERVCLPQILDQIDENVGKALIWKCWLAWKALGFESERDINEFGQWTMSVMERLPSEIEMLPPRSVKLWHDTLERQPQLRILTEYARNAVSRELPGMTPVLTAMPILDLDKNPAYGVQKRKPRMLGEVMDDWISHGRRKNLKSRRGQDGKPYKVADRNYEVPFKVTRDVLGANTFISHIGRDDIIELVEIMRFLPKGAHDIHTDEGLSYREIAGRARDAIEDGEDIPLNADSTLNKYLQAVTTLFNHAQANMWISEHPALKIKIPSREKTKRRALEPEELGRLFHQNYEPQTNTWLPLVMLFHGCRTNEVAQLDVTDVVQRPSGLWCLSLSEDGLTEGKSLKTEASTRIVPIHETMLDRGFLNFVESRRASGATKLFNVGHGAVSFWETIRDEITELFKATGVYKAGEVVPYSLRHTWTWAADAANVPDPVQEAIGGWSPGGSAKKKYGRKRGGDVVRYEPEQLADFVNSIRFPMIFKNPAPSGWRVNDFERVPASAT